MNIMAFLSEAKYGIILSCHLEKYTSKNFIRAFYEKNQFENMTSSSKTYNVAEAIETLLDSFDQCLILKTRDS